LLSPKGIPNVGIHLPVEIGRINPKERPEAGPPSVTVPLLPPRTFRSPANPFAPRNGLAGCK